MIPRKRIQQKITTGKFVLPVVILLSTFIWLGVCFIKPIAVFSQSSSPVWQLLEPFFLGKTVSLLINFFLYACIGYLLIELNNAFTIIRLRASIQTSLFFIVVCACPELYSLQMGSVSALCMVASTYFLFQSYQHARPSGVIFYSWMFLGLGSLMFPQLLFLIPLYLIGAYNFQSLNAKSFFAGLIGLMAPFWFLLGYAFSFNQMGMFYHPFKELGTFMPVNILVLKGWQIVTLSYISLAFIVAVTHSIINGWQDKIRTRAYINFFSLMGVCLIALIILQPQHFIKIFPLLLVCYSFLAGHFFALTRSRGSNIFFIFSVIGLIALLTYNLWML